MSVTSEDGHWVFGYGSLIWRPGFEFVVSHKATIAGAHRSLCIYSHRYRGTPERPGLVFGLRRGGSCNGMAFFVDEAKWAEVREYLREREQVSGVYRETWRQVRLSTGESVSALAFLVDENHPQYAGSLTLDEQVRIVSQGVGGAGANTDYVLNTVTHLAGMGIEDKHLRRLSQALSGKSAAAE